MESSNFIFNEIDKDIENGVCPADGIIMRFPPEPNGYLHIGHAKAICIDFGVKEKYPGTRTNLRFDDTNPAKEDTEYTQSIQEDIKWLGFEWDGLFYASDYFGKMYEYAKELIKKGLAYVDDQTQEQIKQTRGSLTEKGSDSPYRTRSAEENLALFVKMKEGAFAEGERVLRAKIDMASPNINMRDPVIYRILYASHHNTGNEWCIYPMYDYAHPIEDAIEGITHSLCTLEFEDHRPFYDWLLSNLDDYKIKRPRQIEFARLNLSGTVTSKRYLKQLVDNGVADGWDDPRMPTLCGLRRRGVVPEAIRDFCASVGTAKANSTLEMGQFEYFIRNALMPASLRVMAVLDPIKLTITNYPDGESEMLEIPYIMDDENSPARKVPFSSHLLIERSDFMAEPVKKYFRLFPGNEVRLMGAYFVTCTDYKTDANGNVTEVFATYDPETKSGSGFNARKVKGTIHWVDETAALRAEVRLYDDMFTKIEGDDSPNVNASFEKVVGYIEPSVKGVKKAERFQFVRNGFFCCDTKDSTPDAPVFNRTLGLKSSWKPEKTEQ